jgi:hypothetical protein
MRTDGSFVQKRERPTSIADPEGRGSGYGLALASLA